MTELLSRWSERCLWLARTVILLSILIVVSYAADRRVPFRVDGSAYAEGQRGKFVVLNADVWRDTSRQCSVEFARFIFDSSGSRFDLGASMATDAMIRDMERRRPGKLILSIEVPEAAALGPARMVTTLQYRCNKVHTLWPIETMTEIPFTVLP